MRGQTVVILGGSSGIGLATAIAAEAEGATVVITGRNPARLADARQHLSEAAICHVVDAIDETATAALFASLERVDHVFITAGSLVSDGQLAPDSATLAPAINTRFWGATYAAKYSVAKMPAGGSITLMSGTAGLRPLPGAAVASASCGAIDALARALARELAPRRVNSIAPGYVDTPLFDGLLGADRDAVLAEAGAKLPVERIGQPAEIADAVLFLMNNGYVSGTTLVIDGGGMVV